MQLKFLFINFFLSFFQLKLMCNKFQKYLNIAALVKFRL